MVCLGVPIGEHLRRVSSPWDNLVDLVVANYQMDWAIACLCLPHTTSLAGFPTALAQASALAHLHRA